MLQGVFKGLSQNQDSGPTSHKFAQPPHWYL